MIGPLPTAPGGFKFILVAVDKFTKWIEVKPIAKMLSDCAMEFICKILQRFGFPNTIIIDLGSNFTSQSFWDYCENSCIDVKYVLVAHPRANDQVECINGLIIDGLKKRIFDETSKKEGKWLTELPMVVWRLRTQPSKATGRTPFFYSTTPKQSSLQISCGSRLD